MGWWVSDPFVAGDGLLWIGVDAYAPTGIESVRFLVTGLGATSVAEPSHHPHRSLTGYWISVSPSQVSTDAMSVSAVVVPKGTLQPLESRPIEIRKRGGSWDVGRFLNGWTTLIPANGSPGSGTSPLNSRLIYVATAAQGGNDAAARAAKGNRGYYLPSDPEIGPDPTNPVGPIVAYATQFEASKMFRGRKYAGDRPDGYPNYGSTDNPCPDWILFRRGGTWDNSVEVPTAWGPQRRNIGQMIGNWVFGADNPSLFSYHGAGRLGRSATEPFVITAWGPTSDPRPILRGSALSTHPALTIEGGSHGRWTSLHIDGEANTLGMTSRGVVGWEAADGGGGHDWIVEDLYVNGTLGATNYGGRRGVTAVVRRCVVTNAWSSASHQQGFFVGGEDGQQPQSWTIEECVFDRNGYKENPNAPQTWTAKLVSSLSSGELAAGTGVQPTRTYFDRNLYLSRYDSITVRGSIISRGGGGGNVQMREGGVSERNLFIFCQAAMTVGHPETTLERLKPSLIRQNTVLHDDCFLPPGGWGIGIGLSGTSDDLSVADDNVVAHFHRATNGGASISATGFQGTKAPFAASPLMRAVVKDNAVFQQHGTPGIWVRSQSHVASDHSGVTEADVTGNEVSAFMSATAGRLSENGNATRPSTSGYSGNQYHSTGPSASHFKWTSTGDLAAWKAAGYDSDVTQVYSDLASFKPAVGWTAPERDIVSYMQSVDPSYVVNEDVYVDDDSTGPKQATRRRLWEVLIDPSMGLAGQGWWDAVGMTEARAKLVARRYHAFITFIQRAKANRKGAWDPRWTADAVNDYIREGFGKAPVSGPYTATLEDVLGYQNLP